MMIGLALDMRPVDIGCGRATIRPRTRAPGGRIIVATVVPHDVSARSITPNGPTASP
jgi:hypothetical protein